MKKGKIRFDAAKMENLKNSIKSSKSSAVKAISEKMVNNIVGGAEYGQIGYIQTLFGKIEGSTASFC